MLSELEPGLGSIPRCLCNRCYLCVKKKKQPTRKWGSLFFFFDCSTCWFRLGWRSGRRKNFVLEGSSGRRDGPIRRPYADSKSDGGIKNMSAVTSRRLRRVNGAETQNHPLPPLVPEHPTPGFWAGPGPEDTKSSWVRKTFQINPQISRGTEDTASMTRERDKVQNKIVGEKWEFLSIFISVCCLSCERAARSTKGKQDPPGTASKTWSWSLEQIAEMSS